MFETTDNVYDKYKHPAPPELTETSPARYKNSIGESANVRNMKSKIQRAKLYNSAEDSHMIDDDNGYSFDVNP
jgi:hypothetical protein